MPLTFEHSRVLILLAAVLPAAFLFRYRMQKCRASGLFRFFRTEPAEGHSVFREPDLFRDSAIVLGNEANGVSAELLNNSTNKIYIPMTGSAESLNVATAGAMIMYERHRQCFEITSL